MEKERYWIVDFQHTNGDAIKTMATCVTGMTIKKALANAEARIGEYMQSQPAAGPEEEVMFITNIGIADPEANDLYGKVWADNLMDPDPELFE